MREMTDPEMLTKEMKKHKLVLIKFYATWCVHCTEQQEILDQMAPELLRYGIETLSLEEKNAGKIGEQVSGYPTLMIVVDGKPRSMTVGMKSAAQIMK